jgi:hypothetical protein
MQQEPNVYGSRIGVGRFYHIQFSNHTGYPCFSGYRLDADKFQSLLDGLKKNRLLELYSHLLSGNLLQTYGRICWKCGFIASFGSISQGLEM